MEGRWDVQFCGDCGGLYTDGSHSGCDPKRMDHVVPVVPCDDAAIGRAAQALAARQGSERVYATNPTIAEEYREDIRAALRAAGETP